MNGKQILAAMVLMLIATALAVAVPLWLDPAFFFTDDMKHQHLPVMMEIGRRLREGSFPTVTDLSGFGGNLLGEYQYGLFNPVSLLLYAALPSFSDLGTAAALLAGTHYFILAGGVFVLALELGARPFAAALAAVMMVTNLFLAYWLASAWLPGLVATAWLPWALAMLSKARRDFRFIPGGAAAVYLLNASGWPHAIFALGVMTLAIFLLDRRAEQPAVHGGWFALVAGFLGAVPAWIPLISFASMGERTEGVDDLKELFVPPFNALLNAGFPSQLFMLRGLTGWERSAVPFLFAGVAVLIVPALVQTDRWRHEATRLKSWLIIAGVFMLLVMGPAQLGPIRWPLRYVPYFHLALCLLVALLISDAKLDPTPRGLRRAFAWCAIALLIAWQQTTAEVWDHLVSFALLAIATLWIWRLAHYPERAAVLLVGVTLLTWVWVLTRYPSNTNLNVWHAPLDLGHYQLPPMVTRDDVVFTPLQSGRSLRNGVEHGIYSGDMGLLVGMRSWNGYSPMRPAALADGLCMDQFGWTCRQVLTRLEAVDPKSHMTRLQLMGITRLVLDKKYGWWRDPVAISGATLCFQDAFVMVYCVPRAHQYPVTWSSKPVSYAVLESKSDTIRLELTATAQDTDLVLGRAWYPGLSARLDGKLVPARLSPYGLISLSVPATHGGVLEIHWGYPGAAWAWLAVAAALFTVGFGLRLCGIRARRFELQPIAAPAIRSPTS